MKRILAGLLFILAASVASAQPYWRGSVFVTPVTFPDGTAAAPGMKFNGDTNTGWYQPSGDQWAYTFSGTPVFQARNSGAWVWGSGIFFNWTSTTDAVAGTIDLTLGRDAANTLAQRNGTNAQTFRLYGTFTDSSNYERLGLFYNGTQYRIATQQAGTGAAKALQLGTEGTAAINFLIGGTTTWNITTSGHMTLTTDATYDVGAAGANRPRTIYHMRSAPAIATVTYSASMTPDAQAGNIQVITATNGTAFTINAPSNPASGQQMTMRIRNTSGGALGAATWNAVFKMVAWTNPGNGNSRAIEFYYDGTNWVETYRSAADIPN